MKRQIKPILTACFIKAFAIIIFTLFTISTSFAQATYKVGEQVEAMSVGKWWPATIEKVFKDGTYEIEMGGISGQAASDKWLRPKQVPGSPKQANGSTIISNENTVGERYGTREPRTCVSTKAPLKGPITADLAAKYFICTYEGEASSLLYLLDNVKFEVGGGIPYKAIMGHRSLPQIDVKQPVYPIRGSYTRYVYQRIYDKNEKARYSVENVKADGYCYKTTFGDWQCR